MFGKGWGFKNHSSVRGLKVFSKEGSTEESSLRSEKKTAVPIGGVTPGVDCTRVRMGTDS